MCAGSFRNHKESGLECSPTQKLVELQYMEKKASNTTSTPVLPGVPGYWRGYIDKLIYKYIIQLFCVLNIYDCYELLVNILLDNSDVIIISSI